MPTTEQLSLGDLLTAPGCGDFLFVGLHPRLADVIVLQPVKLGTREPIGCVLTARPCDVTRAVPRTQGARP